MTNSNNHNTIAKFFIDFWPSMLTIGVILYATLNAKPLGDNKIKLFPNADKLVHAIMMGGLYGAILFDIMRRNRAQRPSLKMRLCLAAIIVSFSVIDEIGQSLMHNGRSAEVADFVADCIGIAIAYITAPPAIRFMLKIK